MYLECTMKQKRIISYTKKLLYSTPRSAQIDQYVDVGQCKLPELENDSILSKKEMDFRYFFMFHLI